LFWLIWRRTKLSQDELINLGNEVLYNKEIMLSMAQMLKGINNPDIEVRAQNAQDEANKAGIL
jgi:hypothetical protein